MTLTDNQRADLVRKAAGQLDEGETVFDVTFGAIHVPDKRRRDRTRPRPTSVLVTDKRLVFFRNRWRGYDMRTVAYDQLRSVDHGKHWKTGELELGVAGQDPVRITSIPEDDVERIAAFIRQRLGQPT
jgi:hypothetical protein